MPLTIYRSSAGSGKTFTLVKEYLKLVLKRPKDFQHILAITFTNKATEEMKSRVLDSLKLIASGASSDIFEAIKVDLAETHSPALLQRNANEVYELIIHNYSRFEISTIDSFFSRVVRSFSRELDLPMSYELEMNTSLALDAAVDQLFKSLADKPDLRVWLEQFAFEQIENDKSWAIEKGIKELGRNLFTEQFQAGFEKGGISFEQLEEIVKALKKVIDQYRKTMTDAASLAIKQIELAGLVIDDFSGKGRGPANTFFKIKEKGDFDLNDTFLKTASGEKDWYVKKAPKADVIDQLLLGPLGEAVGQIINCQQQFERQYKTALELFKNIYSYGLLDSLNKNLKEYRDDQNIMLISDNNALIREIVKEDDAPFIFEKIGSWFKHIMIDEFQDTSNFQWNNLLPLILNSLSQGNEVLIVGDVKQSIYRFRGGNMRLLLEQIEKDLYNYREVIQYQNLEDNYRSFTNVVNFNNQFFAELKQQITRIENLNDSALIDKAYFGHEQNAKKDEAGFVQVQLFESDKDEDVKWKEKALGQLVTDIEQNIALGFSYEDILVLVNVNKEVSEIAEHLLEHNIPFVSERSLMLINQPIVRFMIEAFTFLQGNQDEVGLYNMVQLFRELKGEKGNEHFLMKQDAAAMLSAYGFPAKFYEQRRALAQMPLFDLLEQLLLVFDFSAQADVFIQKFQDVVLEQTQKGLHSIHGFLEWWVEQGQDTTISGNENANAVTIMSVHKSKGLESPIVIIPFANYSFLPNARLHMFWTNQVPDYLDGLSFIPLNYSKNLLNTDFEEAFFEETLESVLDVLNKTYVAFTRAREKLFIYGPHQESKSGKLTSINQFILEILNTPDFEISRAEESGFHLFSKGENHSKKIKKESDSKMNDLVTYPLSSYTEHLAVRQDSDRFFMLQGGVEAENITSGNQVHEVLSMIQDAASLDAVLNQLTLEGSITQTALPKIKEKVKVLLDHPQVNAWFESDFEALTEREMFYEGRILKPDRVLVKNDQAIVIDYKKDKSSEAYQAQVQRYMQAMRSLGYPNVTGFLVYVDKVEVEEVV
jgi:ATP-dependent helicase/nuclease subunit A